MTEYFEIHERDGAARLGELRLADPLRTPALVDDVLEDAGSLWSADRALPTGEEANGPAGTDDALTILPHRGLPAGTDPEVQSSFAPEYPQVDFPSAAVVHQDTAADLGQDAYVLSSAQGVVGHAAAFAEALVETREAIQPDSALYLPGVATPGNVATLVYAGVDLLDTDRAVIRGTQGRYLTTDGETWLEDFDDADELPCPCPACQQPAGTFDREDCVEHNVAALRAEVARVRAKIRNGSLRDYVEGQARHEQWHTATFRRLDQQWAYLEERTPLVRRGEITAASEDTLRRVEIQRYADRVTSRYRPRFDDYPLVLVPCSASKPYSDSQSHRQFHDAIDYRGHVVSITSPIGVVPAELELTYPAQHYDSVVTGEWSATEVEFVATVLAAYLERADYPRIVAHVPEDYRPIMERAIAELGDGADSLSVEYTVADHPTTEESLGNLDAALDGELRYSKGQRYRSIVRGIADYMLGDGAGDDVFDDVVVHGRYPKLQVDRADASERSDEGQLAAVVPQYGTLAFTLEGARAWTNSGAPVKRVEIDEFVPHGSALAPGVVDADDEIRPGDEVIVEGPLAFGVGRAAMSGPEMAASTRGVAVDVRHVEER
ncbi:tRNA-guanine transglycosylase, various specificities [Salinarchaeum sp. Harcht-Bsk1]|uniref:archaeosine synthase subunit alpha n=1 Tax=Salinarchaeum sp. Harcht-Bsk1 TaxID=1333523 RepID=UPI00034248DE|nr:archaeosine synthase subunit alpha [Salinarchaeum sp. Harcht-Bsk1]AGN01728.1 tRNA-guanine transglycosylase, various specificities [Salinarchaeum sp. Harcht-Bsk1]